MPTTPMLRVTTVVTGVAGSPYYIRGYFNEEGSDPDEVVDNWHTFVIPDALSGPTGSTWTTDGPLDRVDPVSGDVIGQVEALGAVTTGTNTGQLLPPSNQTLFRWRTGVYVNGREIRGRTNKPLPFLNNSNNRGSLAEGYRSGQEGLATTLLNQLLSPLVVWSKKNGRWEAVTSASVWQEFAVLTSRRD